MVHPRLLTLSYAARQSVSIARKITESLKRSRYSVVEDVFTLDDLVKEIVQGMKRDTTVDILVDGHKGVGKTTFALMLAWRVFRKVYGAKSDPWQKALDNLFFRPTTFLTYVASAVARGERIPVAILDDAGAWLGKWIMNAEKEAFFNAYDLSRTVFGGLIFTNVASIAKYIRSTVTYRIRIDPLDMDKRYAIAEYVDGRNKEILHYSLLNPRIKWSQARIYETWFDLKYEPRFKRKAVFYFPVLLPNNIYKAYIEKRQRYTKIRLALSMVSTARKLPDAELMIMIRDLKTRGVWEEYKPYFCGDPKLWKRLPDECGA